MKTSLAVISAISGLALAGYNLSLGQVSDGSAQPTDAITRPAEPPLPPGVINRNLPQTDQSAGIASTNLPPTSRTNKPYMPPGYAPTNTPPPLPPAPPSEK